MKEETNVQYEQFIVKNIMFYRIYFKKKEYFNIRR